jgi:dTDP-4-dehydrorhamnose 3,5-epimerase
MTGDFPKNPSCLHGSGRLNSPPSLPENEEQDVKIIQVKSLAIPDIKVIRFGRFPDQRGYFTEPFRKSDFQTHADLPFMRGIEFLQVNESHSRANVVRGLHFQWSPYMGKLVRTIAGRMVDMVLDIRLGSPYFGKIIAYDMPSRSDRDYGEWIWVPPGFAHGNFFTEETSIEYFCSGEYGPTSEAGISPLTPDLDWSLCDHALKRTFDEITAGAALLSDKDRNGLQLAQWHNDARSKNFIYGQC